jgi:hypothetical protein
MRKLASLICGLLLLSPAVQAADNYLGTWTLNVAKSKYDPGPPAKGQTTLLEPVSGGGLKEVGDRENADGSKTHWEWAAKYDGKDYPVMGDPSRDSVALKRVDDNTLEVTNKKGGKLANTMKIIVAKDGRSRTNESRGPDGKVHNVLVFDKK